MENLGQASASKIFLEPQEYARAQTMSSHIDFSIVSMTWGVFNEGFKGQLLFSKGGHGCPNARENEWYYQDGNGHHQLV